MLLAKTSSATFLFPAVSSSAGIYHEAFSTWESSDVGFVICIAFSRRLVFYIKSSGVYTYEYNLTASLILIATGQSELSPFFYKNTFYNIISFKIIYLQMLFFFFKVHFVCVLPSRNKNLDLRKINVKRWAIVFKPKIIKLYTVYTRV